MPDSSEENACPNCEAANPAGTAFCTSCGTKLIEQGDGQAKTQPFQGEASAPTALVWLRQRPKVLVVGSVALVVILIAALVVGLSGSNQSAPLTAVQRNCEAPAGAYVVQMLSAGPMNSNEISNDLISAMERFGQSSIVYHAISDAESQAIAIEVQQGEKAAILQAAQIIKADCTNSISNSGASGMQNSSGSNQNSTSGASISSPPTEGGLLAVPSISATSPKQQITVGVTVCPSFSSQTGETYSGTPQPLTTRIYVGASQSRDLEVYTDAGGSSIVTAPKGWSCRADGNSAGYSVFVYPPGATSATTLTGIVGITSNGFGHSYSNACNYFPSAISDGKANGFDSCDSSGLVSNRKVVDVGTNAVIISASPGQVFENGGQATAVSSLSMITYNNSIYPSSYPLGQTSLTTCALPSQYQKDCYEALLNTPGLFIPQLGPFQSAGAQ